MQWKRSQGQSPKVIKGDEELAEAIREGTMECQREDGVMKYMPVELELVK